MSLEENQRALQPDDLWGAWESLPNSQKHAWDRGVIVFKPYGRDVVVEHWLPPQSKSDGPTKIDSLRGGCNETPFGMRLSLRSKTVEKTLDIVGAGDGTISIYLPGSNSDAQLFRRATHPQAERS